MLSTVRDEIVRFKIRLANTEGSRSSASYLIQKMYGWRGYAVSPLSADKRPITIVASDGAQALATISIGFDSQEKLLADELYGPELDSLRAGGARLCEFTRLAVDRNEQSREVLAMMFHVAYMYARRFANCTDLLIEVNPRHVRFYRAMLGFEAIGEERTCPRVNAPAVLLRLDLSYAQRQIARFGGHREWATKVRSLYPLAFSPREEDGICGRLRELG
ncbi:MAG: N-acetyltransferase [Burkholderiaceae bacterium]|nr:N-acetyltransferase [Burkholderiaceae bacterium]